MSNLKSDCPICAETISVEDNTEVSEIIQCPSCNNRIVVKGKTGNNVTFEEAPKIEEDWGE
ncbi:hypothetical protein A3J20_01530 [Candidatus Gottesmanbacteria bacterium RIFCSPLOWO2_02_FULL_42_29]|uniref:Lysine biosynthesis protein LysW n=2 Tax=Candidatus Gottesmaniibacteriota TaxID=1752720 RepID=A0A1F6BG25_9BACT|nr:MAG: hypothetical protein UV09_C0021G0008 [Candidatus Gottesmanbacteria bacterium GW2011_GWA2_42_18]OGG12082.1 MAG: hypothetical protein A2781_03370 [Candidatus Gottesmanbacteria bacterium RIFCSPHIGHO2_01_FULL_42_27]OGG35467.1 MAG: hypothetical protein A2968_00725 [Candidatus Gottesmanbacteria bacterium RIFCSPLOWO2_01_FULL_42_22]OGG38765.1 MAG: hypothetical protein A3J20_01530 [Candidatus Gottesmanbacteria bacterium RIFCSPLOWO2_02_FULL_42_29]